MGKRQVANQSAERSSSFIVQRSFFVVASNICHVENNLAFKNHKNWLIVKDYKRKGSIQWSVLHIWKTKGNEELPTNILPVNE